ncbi:hypothetical protein C2E23DRAFT_883013 [Lenzites betulinus]|nr:hypothetical protein C2E23DRAFT_883013 [Lenzites betulinus]
MENEQSTFAAGSSTSGGTPLTNVVNTTSQPLPAQARDSPRRVSPHGHTLSSPTKRYWDDDSEEARILRDMGIGDEENEDQVAAFNSIPGFDEEWPDEDRENTAIAAATFQSHGLGAEEDWIPPTCINPRDLAYAGEYHADSDVDDPQDEDGTVAGATSADDDLEEFDSDDNESDSERSSDSSVDTRSGFNGPTKRSINEVRRGSPSSSEEDSSVSPDVDTSTASDSDEDASEAIDSSHRAPTTAPAASSTAVPLGPRRSARIIAAPKRPRANSDDEEYELPQREVKRPRRRAVTARTPSTKASTSSSTPSVHQTSATGPSARKNKGKARARQDLLAPKTKAKRWPRIPVWYLESRCIANDPATMACGVDGCSHVLDFKKLGPTREHLRAHHGHAQLAAAEIQCLWDGCPTTVKNASKNAGGLMRHYEEKHLALSYACPGRCTDASGVVRTWVRSDEITRHEKNEKCAYLLATPIPRGQKTNPDAASVSPL